MKIERLLTITIILLNNKKITAQELSEKLGVSLRTIYRDIDSINNAGIPIISYPGNNGGFGILDTFKLDKHIFTNEDINSVLSTLKAVTNTLGESFLGSALEKLVNIGISRNSSLIENLEEKFVIDFMPMGYTFRQNNVFGSIIYALNNNLLLNIDYCNANGEITHRQIEPMTLVFKTYAWYVFAFCRLKNACRFFKLSRISNPITIITKFQRRTYKYSDFEQKQITEIETSLIILKFSSKMKYRVEDYFTTEQIEYNDDGSMMVKANWRIDEWVYGFILSFTEDVEVISPIELKNNIYHKLQNIFNMYQS
jgi:predicted DNA-binding transcriptional regulator YafY